MIGALSAAALAGLASIPHCAVMCGPVCVLASGTRPRDSVRYHLARLVGYGAAGGLVGALGAGATGLLRAPAAQAALSFSLAAGLGWSAWRLWHRPLTSPRLVPLRREGRRLPPVLIGLGTTVLPCGALGAALLIAAGSGSGLGGAACMLLFGALSAPGLLGAAALASRLSRLGEGLRRAVAVALALGAIVLVLRPIAALRDAPPVCHSER